MAHERRQQHWYARLMTLTDGVFAISVTLLAADIRPPASWRGDLAALWAALASQLDAYAMSFLVIAIFWLAHRRFMGLIERVDAPLTVLTLLVLGLVALLPPATRLMSANPQLTGVREIYAGLVIAIGFALAAFWAYAALIASMVDAHVSRRLRWYMLAMIAVTPPFFLVITMAIPRLPPGGAAGLLLALFLIGWRLRMRIGRRLAGVGHPA